MKTRLLIIAIIAFVVGAVGYLVLFYDLAPSTRVNEFGISARIVHGFDDRIMCPTEPCDTSIYLMHIHSEMPGFVTGYNICKGITCISIDDSQLFVGPENDPRNQIVYLSRDVPWQVGDIVNIRLDVAGSVSVDGKNYPDPQKRIHLDLGNSIVVEQNNPYSSIGMSKKDANQTPVEQQPLKSTIQNSIENKKINLLDPTLPKTRDGLIDYHQLIQIVSRPVFVDLFAKMGKSVQEDDLELMIETWIPEYTEFSSMCGYTIVDDKVYWLQSELKQDTITKLSITSENPDPCKPSYDSCFCQAQHHLAEKTTTDLSHFDESTEAQVGKIFADYLSEGYKVTNVSNSFVIGKYNLDIAPDIISYCGQFQGNPHQWYFHGHINGTKVVEFALDLDEKQKLCAINDNPHIFTFYESAIVKDSFGVK
jgi:hypothetical protein